MRRFFFAITCLSLLPFVAAAADVTVTERTTLILPNDNTQYTLEPSTFNNLTVNSDSFGFTMPERTTVELFSTDKKNLSNDFSPTAATVKCNSNESRVILDKVAGATTQTVTVTPSGTCSSTSSSGGGGSVSLGSTAGGTAGSGSSSAGPIVLAPPSPAPVSTTTTIAPVSPTSAIEQQLKDQLLKLQNQLSNGQKNTGIFTPFLKNLAPGQRSNDVKKLQELLANDKSIYPEGLATGLFGPATVRAVKRFQAKYGLPAVGNVGPLTRKKINELFRSSASPTITPPAPVPTPKPYKSSASDGKPLLSQNLKPGDRGDDVKKLQELLANDKSIYPEGKINGVFGPATLRAVKRFQTQNGLAAIGVVGPATRAMLEQLFGK